MDENSISLVKKFEKRKKKLLIQLEEDNMKEEEAKDTLLKDSSLHPHPCLLVEYVRDVNCVLPVVPLRRLEGNALGVVDGQLRCPNTSSMTRWM